MREIGVRQLRGNLAKELEHLPFRVIRHGKAVCEVLPPAGDNKEDSTFRPCSKEMQLRKGGRR